MSVGYGSNIVPPELAVGEVGYQDESIHEDSWWDILSWFVTGLAVGLAFIPGIGWVASTAIEAANFAAQAGIEYAKTGSVSTTSWIINSIGLATPGLVQGAGLAIRGTRNLIQAGRLTRIGEQASTAAELQLNAIRANRAWLRGGEQGSALYQGMKATLATEREAGELLSSIGRETSFLKPADMTRLALNENKAVQESAEKLIQVQRNMSRAGRLGTRVSETTQAIQKTLREAGLTTKEIQDLSTLFRMSKTSQRAFDLWVEYLSRTRSIEDLTKMWNVINKAYDIDKVVSVMHKGYMWNKFNALKNQTTKMTKQAVNLAINPQRLVKRAFDKMFEPLEKQLVEYGEKIGVNISRALKNGTKGAIAAEKAFIESGGITLKSSWIMGYKTLEESPAQSIILIQFKGLQTHDKKPVLVSLTNNELIDFISSTSKGRWYLDNIARSRGGRTPEEAGLTGEITNYLGFLPVKQIREVLAIANTSRRLEKGIVNGTGIFGGVDNWLQQLGKAFVKEAIGKTADLGAAMGSPYLRRIIKSTTESALSGEDASKAFNTAFKAQFTKVRKRKSRATMSKQQRQGKSLLMVSNRGISTIKALA